MPAISMDLRRDMTGFPVSPTLERNSSKQMRELRRFVVGPVERADFGRDLWRGPMGRVTAAPTVRLVAVGSVQSIGVVKNHATLSHRRQRLLAQIDQFGAWSRVVALFAGHRVVGKNRPPVRAIDVTETSVLG